ncbi:hypothetical protein BH10CHL1_BH10CHL1_46300 [soil metagenome]
MAELIFAESVKNPFLTRNKSYLSQNHGPRITTLPQ